MAFFHKTQQILTYGIVLKILSLIIVRIINEVQKSFLNTMTNLNAVFVVKSVERFRCLTLRLRQDLNSKISVINAFALTKFKP